MDEQWTGLKGQSTKGRGGGRESKEKEEGRSRSLSSRGGHRDNGRKKKMKESDTIGHARVLSKFVAQYYHLLGV
jgi:hypothetical protein